jgi:hypothetical protein
MLLESTVLMVNACEPTPSVIELEFAAGTVTVAE